MIRFIVSFFSGLAIALGLFWLMQYMVMNNQQGFHKTDNIQMTEFVRLKRESKIQVKKRQIPKQPKLEKRPPAPTMPVQNTTMAKMPIADMDMPKLDIPVQNSRFSESVLTGQKVAVGKMQISSNVIPLVRIPPIYPMRAANRHIQGWVKIEFTISKEGKVKNPVVIASKPSSIFNRAALKAIKRWKFKPHLIAGVAQEQRAVQILEFKLSR